MYRYLKKSSAEKKILVKGYTWSVYIRAGEIGQGQSGSRLRFSSRAQIVQWLENCRKSGGRPAIESEKVGTVAGFRGPKPILSRNGQISARHCPPSPSQGKISTSVHSRLSPCSLRLMHSLPWLINGRCQGERHVDLLHSHELESFHIGPRFSGRRNPSSDIFTPNVGSPARLSEPDRAL